MKQVFLGNTYPVPVTECVTQPILEDIHKKHPQVGANFFHHSLIELNSMGI